ncbi:MAG TPA: FtsX-like permease family protein, partial [Vicinamibacterales bacterium]|nr:FtsX-like permease family protein [Vicinamibacterales bacterium]
IQTLGVGSIPRVLDVTLDRTVLAFAVVVSIATGVLFGLAPAWQAARGGIGVILKEGGRSSSTSGGRWIRSGLLVTEVALSLVLLVGASLLLRSFAKITGVDPGFRPDGVLAFRVALPQTSYPEEHNRIAFYDRLLEKLGSSPGVGSAGMVQTAPMRGSYTLSFELQGRPPAKPGEEPSANHRVVSPGYFDALGIPLKRGRLFSDRDTESSPKVALVDEAFVRRHFPNEEAIGRGIDIGNGTDGFYEIVGIVGDVHHGGLDSIVNPTMYVPYKQDVFSSMWVMVKAAGDPEAQSGLVRGAVREIDGTLPAFSIMPLASMVSESVAQRRFSMLLLSLFAFVALFLAAVGLYGVVAYTVSQRTQEIGVRMAIGAQRGDVLRMVLGSGMKLASLGVVIGIAAALALAGLVASMLFGVTPFDPASYGVTVALLLGVAALACYLPARRAMRVDPLIALRQE